MTDEDVRLSPHAGRRWHNPAPMKALVSRALYLIHRWLGIATCLLVLMWFVSGLVMLYVPFPKLTAEERLPHLAPIAAEALRISPAAALAACPGKFRSVRLAMVGARPAYHFILDSGACSAWTDTGEPLGPVSPETAQARARDFLGATDVGPAEVIERDQWTVYASYNAHRPLYRIVANDAADSVIYVSPRSGEVLVDTTRFERGWNWIGTVLHWIYFTPLRSRGDSDTWRWIVMGLSFPALLAASSGLWLGLTRLRIVKRYPRGRITPYRGTKRWHHLLGLTAGLFAFTWLLSGWLSVHPFGLLKLNGLPPGAARQLAGGALRASDDLPLLQRQLARAPGAREAEWFRFGGKDYLEISTDTVKLRFNDQAAAAAPILPETFAAAIRSIEKTAIASAELIHAEDLYYYSRSTPRALPAVRVRLADPEETTWYLDPATGRILLRVDSASRAHRWIFNALHRLDFPPLGYSSAWTAVITTLCLLGAMLAASACVIGWRRTRQKKP